MRESEVETYLKKRVEEVGGETRKLQYKGRHGATDRLVLLHGRHFVAEMKRPRKDAEAHQAREHKILRWAGFEVHVIDTKEKVDKVLSCIIV